MTGRNNSKSPGASAPGLFLFLLIGQDRRHDDGYDLHQDRAEHTCQERRNIQAAHLLTLYSFRAL